MLTDYSLTPCAKRVLNLFLLVDTSGSMHGEKIAACNDAIRNVIPMVSSIGDSNPDSEIKLSVMTFADSCRWLNSEPVAISSFQWTDQSADGCTQMGEACCVLNKALSHKTGMLQSASGSYAPVCIMISDGAPTDDFNAGIAQLNTNNWFRHSTRLAIAIGNDADKEKLATFTGSADSVYTVHNVEALKSVIKCLVVTSTMVCSHGSSSVGSQSMTKSEETVSAINEELSGTAGIDLAADRANIFDIDLDEFD